MCVLPVAPRARVGFYTLNKKQRVLQMEAHTADAIIADFLAQRSNLTHGSNIRRVAKKYQVDIEALASLAIVTYRVPDLTDPAKRAQLPPSQHKTIAGLLLQGCAQAEDPLAIVHIMTAVYLSTVTAEPAYKEIARLFPQSELVQYRKTLEKIGSQAQSIALGPEALTLQGLFLEKEGQRQKAQAAYEEAVKLCHFKFNPRARHPMQIPLITPWNALGYLLKSDQDPSVRLQAKTYFEKGAFEGDDPLSYYELSAFEERTSTNWLQYTSKAAASGHREAMVNLAAFYQDASTDSSPVLADSKLKSALGWLTGWKSGSAAALAREWLQAAANVGHKPSLFRLADHYEATGDHERAREALRRVLDPPGSAERGEEWPQLVQQARKRLAGIRT
ncbi:hypothetical protein P153DRAFT_425390 [Dothidotthia symphoricarpi CBS 119687]|uniref:HCP-like protein n=1 Tax=Dothidotthia symphoricarpi CBS 119687 TaxID=1392245 RepID=A0A6A6A2I9_9PLEO|nr:uncharacterized protein P153DRAFT_425390 [Dothidotthia symphoricarpi CBS 119687]KAF2126212.1 hypothetical protein P153DRAFT_425390 [Dothidotthia symphoricarpi CBS 119687]